MVSVCFYFQVHQPYRLGKYTIFDIGKKDNYFDEKKNKEVFHKVAEKCYLPANKLMLKLLKKHPDFKISYSLSGTFIDQAEQYDPDVLNSFQRLADTKKVEFLDETYYHSLSFLFSKREFKEQVKLHNKKIRHLFNQAPKVFRNTELIYSNELASFVEDMGYKAVLAEGADHVLKEKSPDFIYSPVNSKLKLLLKNYKLSDDIAFRFSNKGWNEYPLNTEKFASWANKINGNGNVLNLFMDYETFGEHQWADTGIFNFMENLPSEILKHKDNNFMTPSEVSEKYNPVDSLDIHNPVSWADVERDLSAWLGNKIQESAIKRLYEIESTVKQLKDPKLLQDWRKLTTSDHFYYMCTKWFNDGDVHKYFNPYDSPYDAYISFMNVINDMVLRLKDKAAFPITLSNPQSSRC